jgi:hypothetical protein
MVAFMFFLCMRFIKEEWILMFIDSLMDISKPFFSINGFYDSLLWLNYWLS